MFGNFTVFQFAFCFVPNRVICTGGYLVVARLQHEERRIRVRLSSRHRTRRAFVFAGGESVQVCI